MTHYSSPASSRRGIARSLCALDCTRALRDLAICAAISVATCLTTAQVIAQPTANVNAASPITRADSAIAQTLRPDLAVVNTSASIAGGTLRLTTCVKNIGVGRSRESVLQVAFGGQWREPPPAGFAVGAPYAFERQVPTKALNAGEEQCHTINSGIADDDTYRKSCREITVRADLAQNSGDANRANNEAKWSDCHRGWIVPRQSVTPLTTKPSTGAQPD